MEFKIKFNEIFKLKIQTKDNVDVFEIDVGNYLPRDLFPHDPRGID